MALALMAAAACGGTDEAGGEHLKGLAEGMTTAQAIDAMGTGPLAATYSDTQRVVNGFRRSRYFINGANFEVVYARDLPGDVKDPLLQANETPVVFKNDTLIGWGWKYYAEEAIPKLGLPTPLRAIDTMTTPAPTKGDSVLGMPGPMTTVPDTVRKN